MQPFWVYLLLLGAAYGDVLEVIEPLSLWKKVVSRDGKRGFVSFSRSDFGNVKMNVGRTVRLLLAPSGNEYCCQPISFSSEFDLAGDFVLLAKRGKCSFGQKAKMAEKTGAIAVIVGSDLPLKQTLDILPILVPNGNLISN